MRDATGLNDNFACVSDIRDDPSADIVISRFGVLAPRISGSLSAAGSILIMYLVFASPTRLSTTYHRIMFIMSFFDLLASVSMALTCLPMPRNDPIVDTYCFQGSRFGNFRTCEAQAFLRMWGSTGTYFYNLMLCIYYAVSIGLQIEKRVIDKYIEPIMHILFQTLMLVVSLIPFFHELYNPSIYDPWCTLLPLYAFPPENQGGWTRVRGDYSTFNVLMLTIASLIIIDVVLSFLCLLFATVQVWRRRKKASDNHAILEPADTLVDSGAVPQQLSENDMPQKEIKLMIIQSICYFLSLVITLLFPSLFYICELLGTGMPMSSEFLKKMSLIFEPLQGFLNFFIFLGSKIALFRLASPNMSTCKILHQMFFHPQPDPLFMTRMDIVDRDIRERRNSESLSTEEEPEEIIPTILRVGREPQVLAEARSFSSFSVQNLDGPEGIQRSAIENANQQENIYEPIESSRNSTSYEGDSLSGFSITSNFSQHAPSHVGSHTYSDIVNHDIHNRDDEC